LDDGKSSFHQKLNNLPVGGQTFLRGKNENENVGRDGHGFWRERFWKSTL
jgi:hypothetical protein